MKLKFNYNDKTNKKNILYYINKKIIFFKAKVLFNIGNFINFNNKN